MRRLCVLHRQPLAESDWLITVFCRDLGRLMLVSSHRRKTIEPTLHCAYEADWRQMDDWPTLYAVSESCAWSLQGDHLLCGLYINELLMRFLSNADPAPALYDRYEATLAALSRGDHPEPWLRMLEYQLLEHAGYGFDWHLASDGLPLQVGKRYQFLAGIGLVPSVSGDFLAEWLLPLAGSGQPDSVSWMCAKRILRMAIDHALDHPLSSRQLFSWRNEV